MTGYEPFFGVPEYGEMPIYLFPLLLLELLWVIGMGVHFISGRRRERWGCLRAVAGWGIIVVLTSLTSHAAFKLVPLRLVYPAVALIVLGAATAPAAGSLVAGFFRKWDSAALSVIALSMLLILYGVGRGAGRTYEEGTYRGPHIVTLSLIKDSLEQYRDENGDYPKQAGWTRAIAKHMEKPVAGWPDRKTDLSIFEYRYAKWVDAEDDDIQISCHVPATTYLPDETLAVTFGGKIVRK